MANSVQLSGTLIASPSATSDTSFPAGTDNIPFNLNPPAKVYNVSTGNVVAINSPSAFVAIPGIGAAPGPVTQGQLLYVRSIGPMQIRKTYGAFGVVGPEPFSGLHIIESDPSNPLTLLEFKGSGTIEFWSCGVQ
jgi:hypothetical protein